MPRVYPVLRGLATLYIFRADHVRSRQLGRQILDLAEVEGDPQIRVDGHLLYGQGLAFGGRIEDGIPELEARSNGGRRTRTTGRTSAWVPTRASRR